MWSWNTSAWFAVWLSLALKSSVILGAAWLAAWALRGRSAAERHVVWTAAAAAVLALPLLTMTVPAVPVGAGHLPGSGLVFRVFAFASDAPAKGGAAWGRDVRWWIVAVWVAGTLAGLWQMILAYAAVARLRRRGRPVWERDLAGALRAIDIRGEVGVVLTPAGTMPMVVGIRRPAVLLPEDAAEWPEERRRMVVLHELAHVRRGDLGTHLVARVALCLNWWNPLAWVAWNEFLKERERAADDLVLEAGTRATEYAGHLLAVARGLQSSPAEAWAAVAMARPSQLEGRLSAILDSTVKRKAPGRTMGWVAAAMAVAVVVPFAAMRATEAVHPTAAPRAAEVHTASLPMSRSVPPAAPRSGALRLEKGMTPPMVVSKVEPKYSEDAREGKLQGVVVLRMVIDEDGRPQDVQVTRGLGMGLDEKAMEAVRQWRFRPAYKDGQPVATQASVEMNFRLL